MNSVSNPEREEEAVRRLLVRMSEAWRSRRYDELAEHFDERVVIEAPGFERRVKGRDACVRSYRDFMERATIEKYEESAPTVDVWGDTAVARYRWEMGWSTEGTRSHEAGQDVFVLRLVAPHEWRVVWRTLTVEQTRG